MAVVLRDLSSRLIRALTTPSFVRGVQLAVRAGAAASLSLAIAKFFDLQFPIYAFIAAVIVTDLSPLQTRQLGLRRLVATVVGAVCGAVLSPLLPPGPLAIGLSVVIAMVLCDVLGAPEGAKVSGYICGLVVFYQSSEPWSYAFFRFMETGLGVAVAWLVSYVPKLIRAEEPKDTKT